MSVEYKGSAAGCKEDDASPSPTLRPNTSQDLSSAPRRRSNKCISNRSGSQGDPLKDNPVRRKRSKQVEIDPDTGLKVGEPLYNDDNEMSGRVVSPTLKQLVHNLFKSGGFENLQGYQLEGHKCITSVDKRLEREAGGSLLYGEVLPEGVARLLDDDHLSVRTAKVLYDFGMGTGKLCLQVFLEYPHLDQVVGIEISPSRYKIGAQALRRLAQRRGFALLADNEHRCKVLQLLGNRRRILEFRCGDAFATLAERSEHDPHVSFVGAADIILLNTDFPESCHASICELLFRMALGARTASYGDLRKMYLAVQQRQLRAGDSKAANRAFPMVHYPINDDSDRFRTTWSPKLGHHFFLFHRGPFLKKAKV